jgi:hypothetical protein
MFSKSPSLRGHVCVRCHPDASPLQAGGKAAGGTHLVRGQQGDRCGPACGRNDVSDPARLGGGEAVADAEGRRCAAQSDSLGETKYKQAERPRHGADSVCALRGTC